MTDWMSRLQDLEDDLEDAARAMNRATDMMRALRNEAHPQATVELVDAVESHRCGLLTDAELYDVAAGRSLIR